MNAYKMKQFGVRIDLDEFESVFSSFTDLENKDFDGLKIDQ